MSSNLPVTISNLRVRRLKARVARLKTLGVVSVGRVGRLKARVRRSKAQVEAIKPRIK